ncbi:MAG: peptidylprolyl isomerase [Sinobacterium sp.]
MLFYKVKKIVNELTITKTSTVSLNFNLSLDDGQLVDGNMDRQAASFEIGDGTLLPGFELNLLGMKAGETGDFMIEPVNGFGVPNINNIQLFSRSQFSGIALEIGTVVSFYDAPKADLPGVVKTNQGDRIELDFNHPLAGKSLRFEVKIVEVS